MPRKPLSDVMQKKDLRLGIAFSTKDAEALKALMTEDGETVVSAYIRRLIHDERKRRLNKNTGGK